MSSVLSRYSCRSEYGGLAIFILRIYCIYGRDWKVAVLIGVFLLVEVIVKLVSFVLQGGREPDDPNFHIPSTQPLRGVKQ